MSKTRTKTEIARELGEKIHAHLQRFEHDKEINRPRSGKRGEGITPYFMAGASGSRHRVFVRYVSYQGGSYLSVEQAARYLEWLDLGNVGTHHRIGIHGYYSP